MVMTTDQFVDQAFEREDRRQLAQGLALRIGNGARALATCRDSRGHVAIARELEQLAGEIREVLKR
jgi:hypothetical protein